jgi:hypothetical protein
MTGRHIRYLRVQACGVILVERGAKEIRQMRILLFAALFLAPISAVALTSYRTVMRRARLMQRQRGA